MVVLFLTHLIETLTNVSFIPHVHISTNHIPSQTTIIPHSSAHNSFKPIHAQFSLYRLTISALMTPPSITHPHTLANQLTIQPFHSLLLTVFFFSHTRSQRSHFLTSLTHGPPYESVCCGGGGVAAFCGEEACALYYSTHIHR